MASKKKVTKKTAVAQARAKAKAEAAGAGKSVEPLSDKELAVDNAEVRESSSDHCSLLSSKAAARKKINADISASRNALVARGMNRAALNVVEKCANMEPQHAEGFALTLIIGLKAIGQPLQGDLFEEPVAEVKTASPKPLPEDQVPASPIH